MEYTVAVCGTEMRSDMAAVKAGARGRSASLVTSLAFEVDVVDYFRCLGFVDSLNNALFPWHQH